jgi:diaminopimelate decarboxylase
MHDFVFKNNRLYCEHVSVEAAAKKFGTPLYLYSHHTLVDHYRKLARALAKKDVLICYSVKANSNLGILKALVDEGAGLDVVSAGELRRAQAVGVAPKKVVYAGVGKTEEEIALAVRWGILSINVESVDELRTVNDVARRIGKKACVSLRINPDVSALTHRFITTGLAYTKFGIDFDTARDIMLQRERFSHIDIRGVHVHIGSQIIKSSPFVRSIQKTLRFIDDLQRRGVIITQLNIGGGLGIVYKDEHPQTAQEFSRAIFSVITRDDLKLIIEPGRFIAGNAGILVTKVLYVKKTPAKRFVIVDAGMNDLIRPALYEAYHTIVTVRQRPVRAHEVPCDVVGPVCETADFFGKDRKLGAVKKKDLVAVMGAGAYGFSMASNYNSRPRAAEVMVKGSTMHLIRAREDFGDLIDREKMVRI